MCMKQQKSGKSPRDDGVFVCVCVCVWGVGGGGGGGAGGGSVSSGGDRACKWQQIQYVNWMSVSFAKRAGNSHSWLLVKRCWKFGAQVLNMKKFSVHIPAGVLLGLVQLYFW